jgi:hypothetical protein
MMRSIVKEVGTLTDTHHHDEEEAWLCLSLPQVIFLTSLQLAPHVFSSLRYD